MSPQLAFKSRRVFLTSAAGALAALPLSSPPEAQDQPSATIRPTVSDDPAKSKTAPRTLPAKGRFPVVAISSANGLEAARKAHELIVKGKDPLDACVEGATIVEDDPNDTSVGYGGLPNE